MAEAPEEVVEAAEEAVAEVETAVHQSLELEEGTPQFTSLTAGKIAVVSPQGSGGRARFAACPKWDGGEQSFGIFVCAGYMYIL